MHSLGNHIFEEAYFYCTKTMGWSQFCESATCEEWNFWQIMLSRYGGKHFSGWSYKTIVADWYDVICWVLEARMNEALKRNVYSWLPHTKQKTDLTGQESRTSWGGWGRRAWSCDTCCNGAVTLIDIAILDTQRSIFLDLIPLSMGLCVIQWTWLRIWRLSSTPPASRF